MQVESGVGLIGREQVNASWVRYCGSRSDAIHFQLNHMKMNLPHAVQAAAAGRGFPPSFSAVDGGFASLSEVGEVGLSACGGANQKLFDPQKVSPPSRLFTVGHSRFRGAIGLVVVEIQV
jgi:hypothetical protein